MGSLKILISLFHKFPTQNFPSKARKDMISMGKNEGHSVNWPKSMVALRAK